MEVYKFNNVFDHVEETLTELYGKDPDFNDVVFVLGYNVLASLRELRTKYNGFRLIVIQLEQLYNGSPWVSKKNFGILRDANEVWDYDHSNVQWAKNNYKLDFKLHPMLYTNSLHRMDSIDNVDPDIDVLFYGYIQERRAKMMFHLQQKMGGRFKFINLYGVWGDELDSYISRSKIILNMHSNDNSKQEQVRMYYPVINGRCVVSEKSPVNYFKDSIIEFPYERMVDGILHTLKSENWRKQAETCSDAYKKLSEYYMTKITF